MGSLKLWSNVHKNLDGIMPGIGTWLRSRVFMAKTFAEIMVLDHKIIFTLYSCLKKWCCIFPFLWLQLNLEINLWTLWYFIRFYLFLHWYFKLQNIEYLGPVHFPISEFSYFIIGFLNHIFLSLTFLISLSDFTIYLYSKNLITK